MLFITYFLLCYFFVNTLGQCPENVQTIPEFDGSKVPIILKSLKMYFVTFKILTFKKYTFLKIVFRKLVSGNWKHKFCY